MSSGDGHGAPDKDTDEHLEQEEKTPPNKKWLAAIGGLIAVFVLLAGYDLISKGPLNAAAASAPHATTHSATAAAAAAATSAASPAARAAGFASTPAATASPSASPSPSTSPSPSASASAPEAQPLSIAAAAAFGPAGTADGDNPGIASRIIGGGGTQPWYSAWYTTSEFGNLKTGTGFLLDMGGPVTVSSVRLVLGSQVGADVEVRVGNTASLGLPVAATATDVGGTVPLTLPTPATGRYVLVWFTRLPPDGQGHYQISVYGATVDGTAGA